jgi:hypothetical protein
VHERTPPHYRLIALAAAALGLAGCSGLPTLEGAIQKVRVYPGDENTSVVVVDFRVTNPSRYPFQVKNAFIEIETSGKGVLASNTASDQDAARYLESNPAQGPKYNPSLVVRDRVKPGETVDRMLAASVEGSAADVAARTALRIRIVDADGPVVVLSTAASRK